MSTEEIGDFLARAATPNRHMYTLVLASHTKRLLKETLPDKWRLLFLGHLEEMVDTWLTPEMIAALEPMDDRGVEMATEIMKVGPKSALDLYAKAFVAFAALNPSLVGVLKMSPSYHYQASPQ